MDLKKVVESFQLSIVNSTFESLSVVNSSSQSLRRSGVEMYLENLIPRRRALQSCELDLRIRVMAVLPDQH